MSPFRYAAAFLVDRVSLARELAETLDRLTVAESDCCGLAAICDVNADLIDDLRAELAERDRQLEAARTVAARNVEAAFYIEERHE